MLEHLLYILQNFDLAFDYFKSNYPIVLFLIYTAFAACLGSFLGCCFYRIPRKISLINPKKSFCPSCSKQLGFLDLFPIISYVLLFAKCRHCNEKIAPTYFVIEILTVLFILGVIYL